MSSRLALRPDLEACVLEDRTLPAFAPGLQAPQFIPTSAFTPTFVVSGFSLGNNGPGSVGNTYPGPQFFYFTIGLSNGGSLSSRSGGATNVYNPGSTLSSIQAPSISSSAGAGGGAYGGAISSGYNTALNGANNYGMGTTAVGSVTAHVSGTTDQLVEAQAANSPSSAKPAETDPSSDAPPPNAGQGPISATDHLLGKGLGRTDGLLIGPGMSRPPDAAGAVAPRP